MPAAYRIARTPFFFLGRRRYREDEMGAYVCREHRRGRRLEEILDDPYIDRCGGRSVLREVLRNPQIIGALGRDVARSIEESMPSGGSGDH